MNEKPGAQTRAFLRPFLVPLVVLISCSHCAAGPTGHEDSGIKGQVLRGPVRPGPETEGQSGEEPFRAVFHVLDERENEVAQFQSDENGRFEILLRPGDYTIVPDASAPLLNPTRQLREVTVPKGEMLEVTLRFDTGLR